MSVRTVIKIIVGIGIFIVMSGIVTLIVVFCLLGNIDESDNIHFVERDGGIFMTNNDISEEQLKVFLSYAANTSYRQRSGLDSKTVLSNIRDELESRGYLDEKNTKCKALKSTMRTISKNPGMYKQQIMDVYGIDDEQYSEIVSIFTNCVDNNTVAGEALFDAFKIMLRTDYIEDFNVIGTEQDHTTPLQGIIQTEYEYEITDEMYEGMIDHIFTNIKVKRPPLMTDRQAQVLVDVVRIKLEQQVTKDGQDKVNNSIKSLLGDVISFTETANIDNLIQKDPNNRSLKLIKAAYTSLKNEKDYLDKAFTTFFCEMINSEYGTHAIPYNTVTDIEDLQEKYYSYFEIVE